MTCSVQDCERPAARSGYCWGHLKHARGERGDAISVPLREIRAPVDVLRDAALTYSDAESDADFKRADNNLQKAAVAYAKRRANRGGRPAKVTPQQALEALEAQGSVRAAARVLLVSRSAIARALFRGASGTKQFRATMMADRKPR